MKLLITMPWKATLVLALTFMAGDLWGHTGHGVPIGHVIESALVSFAVAVLVTWRGVEASAIKMIQLPNPIEESIHEETENDHERE